MRGTNDCVYETPCGWCTKWDKKCDVKASDTEYEPVECAHEWVATNRGGGYASADLVRTYTIWKCLLCGEEKEVED